MNDIIRRYTREAGVRNLEREIAKLTRKAVTKIVKKEAENVQVTSENIDDFLGVKIPLRVGGRGSSGRRCNRLGLTSVGNLLHIEALKPLVKDG